MRDRRPAEITTILVIGIVLIALILHFSPQTPTCTDIKGIGGARPLGLEIIIHCLARAREPAAGPPTANPSPAPRQTSLPFPPNMPGGLPANAPRRMQQTQVAPGPTSVARATLSPAQHRLGSTRIRLIGKYLPTASAESGIPTFSVTFRRSRCWSDSTASWSREPRRCCAGYPSSASAASSTSPSGEASN
jgi:hypothetical protein